jgi:DNA polymerase III subunit beta
MKIVCSRAELNRVISLAQSAASTKNVLPVLTNLLFEAGEDGLTVTGTDLEIGLRVKVKVEVVQKGSATLPAKKLAEIIRSLEDGDVEIAVTDGAKGKIKCGRANIHLVGVPAEDFPNFPGYNKDKSLTLNAKVLADMIKRTAFSVSQDETRYILQGGLLLSDGKKARMVTTDGHRLSYIEQPLAGGQEGVQAVIPSKALAELGRVLPSDDTPVTAYFADNHIFFELGELTLYSRLLDGQFPNYEQVIPKKNEHTLVAEVAPLLAVVNRMSLLAADKGNSIKFHLGDDGLKVTAATADLGEGDESVDVDYSGAAMTVAFNAKYLMDVLKSLGTERLEMKLSTPLSPTLITPVGTDTGARYVVMPMRA